MRPGTRGPSVLVLELCEDKHQSYYGHHMCPIAETLSPPRLLRVSQEIRVSPNHHWLYSFFMSRDTRKEPRQEMPLQVTAMSQTPSLPSVPGQPLQKMQEALT